MFGVDFVGVISGWVVWVIIDIFWEIGLNFGGYGGVDEFYCCCFVWCVF